MKFMLKLLLAATCAAFLQAQNFSGIKPAPQQTAWQDLEFGVILHFSTNTFLDREWGDGTADPKVFNPTNFNPDQWMDAIEASGAKSVVRNASDCCGTYLATPTNTRMLPYRSACRFRRKADSSLSCATA
jgi:hypothetical protein